MYIRSFEAFNKKVIGILKSKMVADEIEMAAMKEELDSMEAERDALRAQVAKVETERDDALARKV